MSTTTSTDPSTNGTGTTGTGTATTTTDTGSTADTAALKDEADKWKAMSRKHEDDAKRLQAELDKIKAAGMSEAEKATEQARQAEERFKNLEATVKRQAIAIEYKLTPDDVELLEPITDETAMRNLAKRLAGQAADDKRKNGNRVTAEGRTPTKAGVDPMREFTRNLFNRGDDE